jgi:hypothetical protein
MISASATVSVYLSVMESVLSILSANLYTIICICYPLSLVEMVLLDPYVLSQMVYSLSDKPVVLAPISPMNFPLIAVNKSPNVLSYIPTHAPPVVRTRQRSVSSRMAHSFMH